MNKHFKRAITMFLASVLLCGLAFAVSAETPYYDTEGDINYQFYEDHAVARSYVGSGGAVVIPEQVRGVPVTGLGERFLFGNKLGITSLTIPRYTSISYLYFEDGTFPSCDTLTAYIVDPLNESICSVDGVLFKKDMSAMLSYPTAKPDTAYTIPNGARIANDLQFANVETLIVGEGVTNLPVPGSKLRSVTLPASFSFKGNNDASVFTDCANLEEIVVHPDNPDYAVQDGILFNKNLTQAICCPRKLNIGEYTIPDRVTAVNGAFCGCAGLTGLVVSDSHPSFSSQNGVLFSKDKATLLCYPAGKPGNNYTVPESVTSIARYAFSALENLTSITFPEGIADIGSNAFLGNTDLTLHGYYYTPLRTASKPRGVRFVALDEPRIDSIVITPSGTLRMDSAIHNSSALLWKATTCARKQ